MKPALQAKGLVLERRARGRAFRLDVPDLSLMPGEVLAVLGANGAGKSTLLRVLAGLESEAAGRIESSAEGPVTMVFQRPIAFAGSVEHNVRIALRARGVAEPEIRERVAEALGHFGIAHLAKRRASRLSGGELRRLALARSFALRPGVLLLDEPFDDLDHEAQDALSRDLRQAVALTHVAVAVVTHDLRRAALVCDRIAVLEDGALLQVGPRDEVLEHPVTVSAARLVGMTNLVEARVDETGQAVVDSEHRIPIREDLPIGTAVCVGLRPEHLKLDVGRGEGSSIGKAVVTAHVSDGVVATIDLSWAGQALRTHMVAGRGLDREIGVGDTVSLSVRVDDVHLLPIPEPGTPSSLT